MSMNQAKSLVDWVIGTWTIWSSRNIAGNISDIFLYRWVGHCIEGGGSSKTHLAKNYLSAVSTHRKANSEQANFGSFKFKRKMSFF